MAPVYEKDGNSIYQRQRWTVEDGGMVYPVMKAYVKDGGSLYEFFTLGVTITLPHAQFSFTDSGLVWNGNNNHPNLSLGSVLSVNGITELFLSLFRISGVVLQNTANIALQLSNMNSGIGNDPGPEFSTDFENSGIIIIEATDGTLLEITGISDATEPYSWTPSNSIEARTFVNHVNTLTDRSLLLTFKL